MMVKGFHRGAGAVVTTAMRVVPFNAAQESALADARRLGVVLDYVLVRHEQGLQEDRAHRRALHAGVVKASDWRGVAPPSEQPDSVEGHPVGPNEFYGAAFDRDRHALLFHGNQAMLDKIPERLARPGGNRGPYILIEDGSLPTTMWLEEGERPVGPYVWAFTRPPHPIEDDPRILRDAFFAIDDQVLANPGDDTEIWHWDGHSGWAEYFWAGQDWWGADAWTVRVAPDRLLFIGASASEFTPISIDNDGERLWVGGP